MSVPVKHASGLAIITELLSLTKKMVQSDDLDFLVESIEKREQLMAEYDALKASSPAAADAIKQDKPQISKMMSEMIQLDKKINRVIDRLYDEAKKEVQGSVQNNKVLKYTNQAISGTGSYFDIKE